MCENDKTDEADVEEASRIYPVMEHHFEQGRTSHAKHLATKLCTFTSRGIFPKDIEPQVVIDLIDQVEDATDVFRD